MTSVKWLENIEAVAEPFTGYQMEQTYRYKNSPDDPGEPVSTMRVRALMIPPGIPDFMTRTRLMDAGEVALSGKAWAGRLDVTKVEVSTDDGMSWQDAELGKQVGRFAWRNWSYRWDAKPGRHYLLVRAADEEGNIQPTAQPWTMQGMGNNLVQRVEVIVR